MKKALLLFAVMLVCSWSVSVGQTYNVTFKADMRVAVSLGTFTPGTDVLTVPGSMNNWLSEPPANSEKIMQDPDGDNIYELTYALAAGDYEYKFNIGTGWDGKDEPGSNSKVTVSSSDLTVTRFFKSSAYTSIPATITFNVSMVLPIKQNANFASTYKVYIAGNFTDWGSHAVEMTDPEGDSVYTVTVSKNYQDQDILSGEILQYKFIYTSTDIDHASWEGPIETPSIHDALPDGGNRLYGVVDGTNTITRFWGNNDPSAPLGSGNMSFTIDMSVVEELGAFDQVNDKVQIRGGFNSWGADLPKSDLNQDVFNPSEWFLSVPFVNAEINKDQVFKYYAVLANAGIWTDAWERPLSTGGGDRTAAYKAESNQEIPKVYYDDVYPQFVVESGKFVQITFRVDMTDAMDSTKQGPNYMVPQDRLFWRSRQPLFQRIMGWTDSDTQQDFELFDPDGDKIYEGTLAVNGPGFNGFEYIYMYLRAADATWQREPTSLGTTRSGRVRYIPQSASRVFTQPYTAPIDTWLNKTDKSEQMETWPEGLPTSVKESNAGLPTAFALEQNYPNPFNPSTTIRFAIPGDEKVSLKIYNVLGQQVSDLLNKEMKAGSYEYKFNASNLSSGIYFYTINAGTYTATRKMIYLK